MVVFIKELEKYIRYKKNGEIVKVVEMMLVVCIRSISVVGVSKY